MFAGHVGAALAIGRAERRINVGIFVCAGLLLDIVLWILVLLGWETVTIPADFARTHQAAFDFPYSHGLLSAIAWSALFGALVAIAGTALREARMRVALLVAAAVFSHWVLDAAVHVPELPLAGAGSPKVGLALWQHLPVGLALEAAVVGLGLWLFLRDTVLTRARRIAVLVLCLLLLAFTIAGMTIAPAPPSPLAMAGSSLVTVLVVCALFGWLGMARSRSRAD